VFGKLTQSPDSTVRMGGNVASNTSSRTVFLFETATRRRRGRIAGSRRMGELAEPGSDGGERAHKAARPQQLATGLPARAQRTIEPLLLHFVHVQQPVRGPLVERTVLDVLADHPGALLVAAAEQAAAVVMMRRRVALAVKTVLMHHG
jgi:hypothetical protein